MPSTQKSQWLFPDAVRKQLAELYKRRKRLWLAGGDDWPISINLRPPSEEQARQQLETLRNWIGAWKEWKGSAEVSWRERQWRILGTQRLPERIAFANPDQIARCIGQDATWQRAKNRLCRFTERWPALGNKMVALSDVLEGYADADVDRLEALISWVENNPQSHLYPRQLPIPGLDSKWFERHSGAIAILVSALRGDTGAYPNVESLCGLLTPPERLRMRLLDPALRQAFAGLGDIASPIEQLASLRLNIAIVFIVENLQTGLSFGDLPGSVVLMAKGYGIQAVHRFAWLVSAQCYYWGDIDTHGFAILNGLRMHVPHVRSLMMDEHTLHRHAGLWGDEPRQHPAERLSCLTPEEHAVYDGLKQQRWGPNVRMEQERVDWHYAWGVCQQVAMSSAQLHSPA
ncbi:MAG TPA: Wadjet anti-phage system protein JetD domain-containing protein [Candidatus Obscuribacterales bacterium]